MNDNYAVDPTCFSDWREVKLLLDLMGLGQGRFLSNYPRYWIDLVKDEFADASEIDKMRLTEIFRSHTNHIRSCPKPYKPNRPWIENAGMSGRFEENKWRAVIAKEASGSNLCLSDVLYDHSKKLQSGVGDHVLMTAAEYARVAEPLFEFSSEVTLVDRFFVFRDQSGRHNRRRERVLRSLLESAKKLGRVETFRLIIEESRVDPTHLEQMFVDDLNRVSYGLLDQDFSVEYDVRSRGNISHGRYLLSSIGGLSFDHGFDEDQRTGMKNHVHWLSAGELQPLQKEYLRSTRL